MKLYDFDKSFEDFVNKWIKENRDKIQGDPENYISELYEQFQSAEIPEIGTTPIKYFREMTDDELLNMLVEYMKSEINVADFLVEEISARKSMIKKLQNLFRDSDNNEIKCLLLNILNENNGVDLRELADFVFETEDETLKELAVEILIEHADEVSEKLLKKLDEPDFADRITVVDILVNMSNPPERLLDETIKLLNEGENNPLYLAYMGKLKNERALPILQEFIEGDVNYLEFMEARNSIEALGGEVISDKDFSQDEYYKALKHLK